MLVLIADEDTSALECAREAVERFGYRCEVVSNGAEVWDALVLHAPDVALVSLGEANLSGLDLLRRIRDTERTGSCYVVAIVGEDDGEGLAAAMAGGADDFLIRPRDLEQLHARLQVAERFALLQREGTTRQVELERLKRTLLASARTDTLTQIWNRLQLNDDLDLFQGQLRRYGHRYAAVIIDLDRFGAFNAAHGQLAGDEALRVAADAVSRTLRAGDRAYRYGGDELMVLLPEQSVDSARIAAERIRGAVASLALPHTGNPPWNVVTVSAGIAAFGIEGAESYDVLLRRAESALEQAKATGGNQVVLDA